MANVLEDSDLDLERYCGKCMDGITYATKLPCTNCEGTGYYMTDLGKRVSEFVIKRMRLHYTAIAIENLKKFATTE